MVRKIMLLSGLALLLLLGVIAVSAHSTGGYTKSWGHSGSFGYGAYKGTFDHAGKLDLFRAKLNLSENATKEDIHAAMRTSGWKSGKQGHCGQW